MHFQPTPTQIEWLGVFGVLGAALHFAERVWTFINKIISDCQRRKQIKAKRKAQQAAGLASKRHAARRNSMPAAIGAEKFPPSKSAKETSASPIGQEPEDPDYSSKAA